MKQNNDTVTYQYAYVYNLQGDVVALVNNAGTKVVNYTYDAWGKPITKSGTVAGTLGTLNPFRYRGYVYDDEIDFYYLRSRYYNANRGRFINADSVFDGINLYRYCYNRPCSSIDPNGTISVYVNPFDCGAGIIQGTYINSCYTESVVPSLQKETPQKQWYDNYKNNDGSYSLYDSTRFTRKSIFREKIISVNFPAKGIDPVEQKYGYGAEIDFMTGGWKWKSNDNFSLAIDALDIGHAEASAAVSVKKGKTGINLSAMASLYSPSISFSVLGKTVSVEAEIGSIGATFKYSPGNLSVGVAKGFGISIDISW